MSKFKKLGTNVGREKRHMRVRAKISGTQDKPRLSVFRSNANIFAQLIDDTTGVTLTSASSVEKDFNIYGGNAEAAKKVGTLLAQRAKEKGISDVVFDRGGYLYHGRVQALADAARESGLNF